MRSGFELLLALLQDERPNRVVHEQEWMAVLALAEEHHVLPSLALKLSEARYDLPEAISIQVAGIKRDALVASFVWCAELRGLLRAFDAEGIPLLPLKGPSLAARVYGDAWLRSSRDLDLLVRRADLPSAVTLLRSLGFRPSGPPDDYHQPWVRGTSGVELHFDVENPLAIDFGTAEAWTRARKATFQGEPAWEFTPHDELRFLALHGVRHRFDRLSLVLDLALATERFGPMAVRSIRDDNMSATLSLGSALVLKLKPRLAGVWPEQPAHIARLADRLWKSLEGIQPGPLDWEAQHRFYLELEPSFRARLIARSRHLRILASRLIAPDYEFAARFGWKRPWQVWLLRPVRLLAVRVGLSR